MARQIDHPVMKPEDLLNECDLEVEIKMIGVKWFQAKVWLAEKIIWFAAHCLIGYYNVKFTHVDNFGEEKE